MSSSESENEESPVTAEEVIFFYYIIVSQTFSPLNTCFKSPNEKEDEEDVTFESLGLVDVLCQACSKLGWKKPSKIQVRTSNSLIFVKEY